MGPKKFSQGHCPRTPKDLSMSTPAWACRPKPLLHGLSLSKSLIKKPHNIIRIRSGRQTKSNKTRLHKAQHLLILIMFDMF